jgi:trigger factor
LIGVNAGDEIEVKVTFPADYGAENLAGKEAVFAVTVKEIRETTPAAIDDELAKKVGMENLGQLKQAISEEQGREYVSLARSRVKRLLLDQLFEAHDFELPQKMVDNEFNTIWAQYEEQKKNASEEEAAEADEKPEDEQKAEFREIAERRVQLGLLLAEVGRQNNIQVAQDDINRAIMEEARNYPGQEEMVLNFFRENPQALENVTAPLYEEKVVDFILELADVTEKKVPLAKFIETLEKDNEEEEKKEKKAKPAKKAAPKKKPAAKKKAAAKKDDDATSDGDA